MRLRSCILALSWSKTGPEIPAVLRSHVPTHFSHEIKFERQTSVANVKGTLHPLTAQASQPKRPHPARGTPDCKRWRAPLSISVAKPALLTFARLEELLLLWLLPKRRINSTVSELHFPPSLHHHNQSASVLRQQLDEVASLLHSSPDQVMSSARFGNNVCVTSHGPTANMSSTCTLMQTSNFSCVNRQVSCSS